MDTTEKLWNCYEIERKHSKKIADKVKDKL